MSWRASAWAKEVTGVSRSEKLLLLILADYYNDEDEAAWPSTPTLAAKALMSERNVTRLLGSLEAKGVIRISRSSGRVNRYHMGGDTMSPLTSRVSTPDIAVSPEQIKNRQWTKSRAIYEEVLRRTPKARSMVENPDKYFKDDSLGEINPANVAAVVLVADELRGPRKEPIRIPTPNYWQNLDRVGAWLIRENGHLSKRALLEAFDEAFSRTVGRKGGEGWDNILVGVAKAPDDFFAAYRVNT